MDCHNPHKVEVKRLLVEPDPNLCFRCHRERQAQAAYPSHHPLREGKMRCTSCHEPHGTPFTKLLKAVTVNQLCFTCHAEKEGPFVYEHPPVTEACTICHDPHGTTANNLLVQNEPFLCVQCHANHALCQ